MLPLRHLHPACAAAAVLTALHSNSKLVAPVWCRVVCCCTVQVLGVAKLGLAVIATFVVCWSPWLYSLDSASQVCVLGQSTTHEAAVSQPATQDERAHAEVLHSMACSLRC